MSSQRYLFILAVLVLLLSGCAYRGDPRVPHAVTLVIDYGPADRPLESSSQLVRKGSSPADVLVQVAETKQGFVCCTKEDIFSVNGVEASYEKNLYWIWELNGQPQDLAPDRYKVRNGDHITWLFRETDLPVHRRRL